MWPDDPELRNAARRLYDATWGDLSARIEQARAWGSDWFAVSTPFLVRSGDEILAHAGVVTCDLVLAGRPTRVAAVHAVCVHPDHRGRGLGRRVIEAALEHIDRSEAATTILWSNLVDFYRRFGFAPVAEKIFLGEAPPLEPCRTLRLDLGTPGHRDLLRRTLATRRPVSQRAAAADDGGHFLIDLALWPQARDFLVFLPPHDAIAVCRVDAGELHLYDVLAPRLPTCAAVVGAVKELTGVAVDRLAVYFTPDLLDVALAPAAHPFEDLLMVRGEPLLDTSAAPFALSPFTRT